MEWGVLRLDRRTADLCRSATVIPTVPQAVEELIWNSIDAGAKTVMVELDLERCCVRVVDNGSGFSRADLELVGDRYCSSKVRCDGAEEKLLEGTCPVGSFGFRGEALSSLSHVALVEIVSKRKSLLRLEPTFRKTLQGTYRSEIEEVVDMSVRKGHGTTISLYDIFGRIPVRRKLLLESVRRQEAQVVQSVQRVALACPNIHFSVDRMGTNPCSLLSFTGANSSRGAFAKLFGNDIAEGLVDAETERNGFRISALLPPASQSYMHSGPLFQFIFVNGRPLPSCKPVESVVNKSYREYFERFGTSNRNKFPCFVVSIYCPPDEYDLILEPTKSTLRFHNIGGLKLCVEHLLQKVLPLNDASPTNSCEDKLSASLLDQESFLFPSEDSRDSTSAFAAAEKLSSSFSKFFFPGDADVFHQVFKKDTSEGKVASHRKMQVNGNTPEGACSEPKDLWKTHSIKQMSKNNCCRQNCTISSSGKRARESNQGVTMHIGMLQDGRVISQIGAKFVLVQFENQIICIDQHAADERVRLERFETDLEKKLESSILAKFALQEPLSFHVTHFQALVLNDNLKSLAQWGFHVLAQDSDESRFSLLMVPSIFGVPLSYYDLLETVEFLGNVPGGIRSMMPPPIRRAAINRACRGAIKFGDELSVLQCENLVQSLSKCKFPFQCAHGRPTCCPLVSVQKRLRKWD